MISTFTMYDKRILESHNLDLDGIQIPNKQRPPELGVGLVRTKIHMPITTLNFWYDKLFNNYHTKFSVCRISICQTVQFTWHDNYNYHFILRYFMDQNLTFFNSKLKHLFFLFLWLYLVIMLPKLKNLRACLLTRNRNESTEFDSDYRSYMCSLKL